MKVYVEGGVYSYERMYKERGNEITNDPEEAELIQFVGGADVSPSLYGETRHPQSHFNSGLDHRSQALYQNAIMNGQVCAGICRGGQFLNVMNGGKLYQHVDGHAIGGLHKLTDVETGRTLMVTSTHHQMMRQGKEGILVATAKEATFKEHMSEQGHIATYLGEALDVEAIWYPDTNCLCFQPHPEFVDKDHECQEYYFELLERYCGYV